MINYVKGDLLTTPDRIIVHGCNAQGVMGSGVAKAIRAKYPKAFDDYSAKCVNHRHYEYPIEQLMGVLIPSVQPDGKIILNAITQERYGKDGQKYVSYDAVDEVMYKIEHGLMFKDITGVRRIKSTNISMPKIGAGLGGGDWGVIESIIKHRLKDHNVTVWEL